MRRPYQAGKQATNQSTHRANKKTNKRINNNFSEKPIYIIQKSTTKANGKCQLMPAKCSWREAHQQLNLHRSTDTLIPMAFCQRKKKKKPNKLAFEYSKAILQTISELTKLSAGCKHTKKQIEGFRPEWCISTIYHA